MGKINLFKTALQQTLAGFDEVSHPLFVGITVARTLIELQLQRGGPTRGHTKSPIFPFTPQMRSRPALSKGMAGRWSVQMPRGRSSRFELPHPEVLFLQANLYNCSSMSWREWQKLS
eukprot:2748653-Amphidinium_carterae.1